MSFSLKVNLTQSATTRSVRAALPAIIGLNVAHVQHRLQVKLALITAHVAVKAAPTDQAA